MLWGRPLQSAMSKQRCVCWALPTENKRRIRQVIFLRNVEIINASRNSTHFYTDPRRTKLEAWHKKSTFDSMREGSNLATPMPASFSALAMNAKCMAVTLGSSTWVLTDPFGDWLSLVTFSRTHLICVINSTAHTSSGSHWICAARSCASKGKCSRSEFLLHNSCATPLASISMDEFAEDSEPTRHLGVT